AQVHPERAEPRLWLRRVRALRAVAVDVAEVRDEKRAERLDAPRPAPHAATDLEPRRTVVARQLSAVGTAAERLRDVVAVLRVRGGSGRDRDRNDKPAHPRDSHARSF